ncbi:MAG: ABC transporter permease [Eubacterium sp.]|nr:ABC transporter permease [Eubacterium sp.]
MADEKKLNQQPDNKDGQEQYSLNDDRRVKVLSPGALVAKRFFRNRLAIVGLVMLIFMFAFSFLGGLIVPYGEAEQFYTYEEQMKDYVNVTKNEDFRYAVADGQDFSTILRAKFISAYQSGKEEFEDSKKVKYSYKISGEDFAEIYQGDTIVAIAYKDIVNTADGAAEPSFEVKRAALLANANGEGTFTADGKSYTLDEDGNVIDGSEVIAYLSRFVVQAALPDIVPTREFKERLEEAIDAGDEEFIDTDEEGEHVYKIVYNASTQVWAIQQSTPTYIYDQYASPSGEHWLGTDGSGMDVLTRLMYGGRVSLIIGFIVVIIETVLGVIMGGIAGYFGGWVDNLIMRLVDIFYCIPSMPIIIILGAAMDNSNVDPQLRMLLLMLILGILGWAGIARLVRGQILSLREQEFMTATEACGIRASRRIFRHLIPNVIPQLIVICTMGLGSTILTEATLSFLGVGVKFPFASWGNIISDVNTSYVMTTYWFVWIPAGICLLVAVLGFNFVGDGLRDAFDPRMKR